MKNVTKITKEEALNLRKSVDDISIYSPKGNWTMEELAEELDLNADHRGHLLNVEIETVEGEFRLEEENGLRELVVITDYEG
jgi:DUF4097 and DUF4098 domain-containing protein YvlB